MTLSINQELKDKLKKEEDRLNSLGTSSSTSTANSNTSPVIISEDIQNKLNREEKIVEKEATAPLLESSVVAFEDRPPEEQTQLSQRDIENSEEFVNNIKIYREARYGTKQTAGADLFQGLGAIPGVGKGVLEATDVNLVDDWLDNYRFTTGNEVNALAERDFLQNLSKKAETYKAKGDIDNFNKTQKVLKATSMLYQDTERLAPIFGWDSTVGGVFSKKRFEGMSASDSALEIIDAVGGHIAAGFSSPSSIFSIGASKFLFQGIRKEIVGGAIKKATTKQATKAILGSAAVGAGIDGAAAGYLDTIVQGTEIEAGVRKNYDKKRTLMAMGIGATLGGSISAFGTFRTARTAPVLKKDEMVKIVKKVEADRAAAGKKKIASSSGEGKSIATEYRKELEDTYGKSAFKVDAKGNLIDIDREAIKKEGRKKLDELGNKTEVVEPAINISMYHRTMGAIIDIFELGKSTKTLREFQVVNKGGTAKEYLAREKRVLNLFKPLKEHKSGKKKLREKISDRVYKILRSEDINLDIPWQILAKYGVGKREYAAIVFSEVSKSASIMGKHSALADSLSFMNRTRTAQEVAEDEADMSVGAVVDSLIGKVSLGEVKTSAFSKFSKKIDDSSIGKSIIETLKKLNNIRRGSLVSAVVTAIRNNHAQFPRMGIDTLIHAVETAPIIGNPNKIASRKSAFAQLKHTFGDIEQAVHMSNMLLELYPKQGSRVWNQYMEVSTTSRRKNPHTETLSGADPAAFSAPRAFIEKGISKGLDTWEQMVHIINIFNRFQESYYRRGALMTQINRDLIDEGKDLMTVFQRGTFNEDVPETMVARGVDYALEFTYGAEPKSKLGRDLNKLITNSPLTLPIPFPRFAIKALEMAFNYNVTGLALGLFKTRFMLQGSRVKRIGSKEKYMGVNVPFAKEKVNEEGYRQLAEGITGSMVLLPLGWLLRDPEGYGGSEWYKLKDGMGGEFDARVYGPILVPYLLIGEYIRRAARGVKNIDMKEVLEALSGINSRNVGNIFNVVTDMQDATNLDGFNKFFATAGKVLGDAAVGFAQPILQATDFTTQTTLKRDYKVDPLYKDGYEAFMSEFSVPFNRRIEPFLNTVDDYFGTEFEDTDFPYSQDPRIDGIPERLIPIFKVFTGATVNRLPPKYIAKLGALGFTYKDYMAKSPFPSINIRADKDTAERVAEEMSSTLETFYQDAKDLKVEKPDAYVAAKVDLYLKSIRKESLAEAMITDEKSSILGKLRRYRSLPARSRLGAVQVLEAMMKQNPKSYKTDKIDLKNEDHLEELIGIARGMDVR